MTGKDCFWDLGLGLGLGCDEASHAHEVSHALEQALQSELGGGLLLS